MFIGLTSQRERLMNGLLNSHSAGLCSIIRYENVWVSLSICVHRDFVHFAYGLLSNAAVGCQRDRTAAGRSLVTIPGALPAHIPSGVTGPMARRLPDGAIQQAQLVLSDIIYDGSIPAMQVRLYGVRSGSTDLLVVGNKTYLLAPRGLEGGVPGAGRRWVEASSQRLARTRRTMRW